MSEHEIILTKLNELMDEIQNLKKLNNPEQDTSLIDVNQMAVEMKCSLSSFRNIILPKMLRNGIAKKYGGRYKARRCDFELFKLQ